MARQGRALAALGIVLLSLAATASAGEISGTVLDSDGKPLAGVFVRAFSLDRSAGSPTVQATADADGKYRIEGVHEGENEITVQSLRKDDSFAVRVATVVVGAEPMKFDIRLPKTELTGRITLADTKAAPAPRKQRASVTVYFLEKRDGRESLGGSAGTAFPGEDGSYRFRGFAPGRYRIYIQLAGYRSGERDLTLKAGKTEGIDFVLAPKVSGLVRFTVVDGDGKPLEGARFSEDKGDVSTGLTVTQGDEIGVYETRELEVGTHEIVAGMDGYEFARTTVEVRKDKTTEVKVVLRKNP